MMQVLEAIRNRRAINLFDTERHVPLKTIQDILYEANLAPSSFNLQPWEVIMVSDAAKKKQLRAVAMDQAKVQEAPVVLVVIADTAAPETILPEILDMKLKSGEIKQGAIKPITKTAMELFGEPGSMSRAVFAAKNTALFAMSIMLAAQGFGLDTHPMDGFDEKLVKELFNIPDNRLVPMLIAVGYLRPEVERKPRGFRRPLERFVWHDKYGQ